MSEQLLRNCQNPMIVYVASTIAAVPAARPSRPSVRFTALDQAATMRLASTTKPTRPNDSTVMSRTNERLSEPGVSPSALVKRSARMPKIVAVSTWPTILDVLLARGCAPCGS